MSKGLIFIILVFTALVAANWLFTSLGSISLPLGAPSFVAAQSAVGSPLGGSAGLPSVNFDLFAKNEVGKSYITQGYGVTPYAYLYPHGWHDGIDIAATYGAPIYSPNDGTVIATGNQDDYCYRRGFGKYAAVKDPVRNLILWYAHLGAISVSPGQNIQKGAEIGTVGATGLETGTHLHFSAFEAAGFTMTPRDGCGPEPTGQDVDPLNYF